MNEEVYDAQVNADQLGVYVPEGQLALEQLEENPDGLEPQEDQGAHVETAPQGDPVADDTATTQSNPDIEAMRKQIEGLEKLVAQSQTKIAESMRTQYNPPQPPPEVNIDASRFLEDPVAAYREMQAAEQQRAHFQEQQRMTQQNQLAEANRAALENKIPDLQNYLDAMVETLRNDGAGEDYLSQVKSNPYTQDPNAIYHLAQRVQIQRLYDAQTKELEAVKAKAPQLFKKISTATKNGPSLSPAPKVNRAPTSADVQSMSDEELDAYIKQHSL